jgi:hypothetical protein
VSILKIDTLEELPAKDLTGSADPYVIVWLTHFNGALATPHQAKSLRPFWDCSSEKPDKLGNRRLEFPISRRAYKSLLEGKLELNVEVWDKDMVFDDFMGYSNTLLSIYHRNEEIRLPLRDKEKSVGALGLHVSVSVVNHASQSH